MAYLTGLKELEWYQAMFCEIFFGTFSLERKWETLPRIPSWGVTDCKSLYDALARSESQGLGLSEKRTAIEVAATRQQMEASGVLCKCVNSDRQLADSLTKPMASHAMKQLCQTGRWTIIFDENFTSAKKIKAVKRDKHFKGRVKDDRKVIRERDPKKQDRVREYKSQTQYLSME